MQLQTGILSREVSVDGRLDDVAFVFMHLHVMLHRRFIRDIPLAFTGFKLDYVLLRYFFAGMSGLPFRPIRTLP